ncbi:MAG: type II toxin-antitoxin system VapC family toxin [Verrucomicrobiota bacterium]|jgi:predicted nucleic acid-binding protein
MKVCADTSFIMKLLVSEPGSVTAAGLYRHLNRPRLPFTQIHQMEVESALAQKAFIARNNGAKKDVVRREKAAGIAKLETWLQKSLLIETEIRWLECFDQTLKFLPLQSEKLGCRTLDLIHISIAICYQAELFVTCDERQAKAAKAEGLKTRLVDIS